MYNLKNVKNTHGGVLILVNLQAEACNFTKINTSPWVIFTFLKLYKWYQIAQHITYNSYNVVSRCNSKENLQFPHRILRTVDAWNDKFNFTITLRVTVVSLLLTVDWTHVMQILWEFGNMFEFVQWFFEL